MFKHLSIVNKIWMSFSIIIIGYLVTIIGLSLWGMRTETILSGAQQSKYAVLPDMAKVIVLFELQKNATSEEQLIAQGIVPKITTLLALDKKSKQLSPPHITRLAKIGKRYLEYSQMQSALLKKIADKAVDGNALLAHQHIGNDIFSEMKSFTKDMQDQGRGQLLFLAAQSRLMRYIAVALFVFMIIGVNISVKLIVKRMIINPLNVIAKAVNSVTKGDFLAVIEINQNDMIGHLGKTINDMIIKLNHLVSEISSSNVIYETQQEEMQRQQKSLNKSNASRQEFIDAMTTFNAKISIDGTVEEINRSATETLITDAKSVIGTPFCDLSWWAYDDRVRQKLIIALELAMGGDPIAYTERITVNGDSQIHFSFNLQPVFMTKDEDLFVIEDLTNEKEVEERCEVKYVIAEGRDITKRIKIEEELEKHQLHLEELVIERTKELEQTQQDLVVAARMAGQAEVATNVLHNVGNVLNSVCIATGVLRETSAESKVSRLNAISEMLEAHKEHLGEFLEKDEKGKSIPRYLAVLSEKLLAERDFSSEILKELSGHVSHLTEIISIQQSHGKAKAMREMTFIDDLIDEALDSNKDKIESNDIKIEKRYDQIPPFLVDRYKTVEILVNLIGNAVEAMNECVHDARKIVIEILEPQGKVIEICVKDTGRGVEEKNRLSIFSHGFTTSEGGQGYGLHYAANAAAEMKGSLRCHSNGVGEGATFTLRLPLLSENEASEVSSDVND